LKGAEQRRERSLSRGLWLRPGPWLRQGLWLRRGLWLRLGLWLRRGLWLIVIWALSVAAVGIVAMVLHKLLAPAR
jgi:hypothetical protein